MRNVVLSLLVSLSLVVAPAVGQAAPTAGTRSGSEQQVLVLLNQIRQQHGLGDLAFSTPLRDAARAHSTDMLQHDYFDHDSPTQTWDARITRYVKSPLIGETIAWGQGSYGTPAGIVSQWMHSPTHRAIILTGGLHKVGLGLATGTFQGSPGAVMATADFSA